MSFYLKQYFKPLIMAKLYTNNHFGNSKNLKPSKETIDFILNFSKSYNALVSGGKNFEFFLN
jgi:hypothetical protein